MYTTELMNQILTSPLAQKIVQNLPPRYGDAYAALWLFQIIGLELDEMYQWAMGVRDQVVPQTATWSLPLWEQLYGIIPDQSWPDERRRQNILNKMHERFAMNPKRAENILSVFAGADVRIKERTGKNQFTVCINSTPYLADLSSIMQRLDEIKPAHLIYDIVFERYARCKLYFAGIIRTAKVIHLRQV